jgi:hypothetical protein
MAGTALVALAGCSSTPNVPLAGTQFDGDYVGPNKLFFGSGFICGLPDYKLSIQIRNGRFTYSYYVPPYGPPAVQAQVYADGSVAGDQLYGAEVFRNRGGDFISAWITIHGRISGGALTATVRDYRCARHLTLQRVGS